LYFSGGPLFARRLSQNRVPFIMPKTKHTVMSDHHPSINICINGQQIGTIGFTVSVSLLLEGLMLKIQDAKIKEIHIGKCSGKGAIMCENLVIIQKKSPDISIPGSFNLGEGVAIMSVDDLGKSAKVTSG
jgi:hypothetical protein